MNPFLVKPYRTVGPGTCPCGLLEPGHRCHKRHDAAVGFIYTMLAILQLNSKPPPPPPNAKAMPLSEQHDVCFAQLLNRGILRFHFLAVCEDRIFSLI